MRISCLFVVKMPCGCGKFGLCSIARILSRQAKTIIVVHASKIRWATHQLLRNKIPLCCFSPEFHQICANLPHLTRGTWGCAVLGAAPILTAACNVRRSNASAWISQPSPSAAHWWPLLPAPRLPGYPSRLSSAVQHMVAWSGLDVSCRQPASLAQALSP